MAADPSPGLQTLKEWEVALQNSTLPALHPLSSGLLPRSLSGKLEGWRAVGKSKSLNLPFIYCPIILATASLNFFFFFLTLNT